MRGRLIAIALLSTVCGRTGPASAQTSRTIPAIAYPQTKRVDVTETQFGVPVADPYRWLENDVRNDADVREITEENERSELVLLAGRGSLKPAPQSAGAGTLEVDAYRFEGAPHKSRTIKS